MNYGNQCLEYQKAMADRLAVADEVVQNQAKMLSAIVARKLGEGYRLATSADEGAEEVLEKLIRSEATGSWATSLTFSYWVLPDETAKVPPLPQLGAA